MTVWILSFSVGWLWLSSAIAHYCLAETDADDGLERLARIIAAIVLALAAPIILAVLVIKRRRNAAND